MKKFMLVVCCVSVLLVSLGLSKPRTKSKENRMPREFVMLVPDFNTATPDECDKSVNKTVGSYHEVITEIMRQLHEGNTPNEAKVHAIYLLGQLRATAAVTMLIENIDLKASKVDPKTRISRWGVHPAQGALVMIGKPAVNMIIERLPSEKKELRRKLMCSVIMDVEGKAIGKILVKNKHDQEKNPQRKANLKSAMRFFAQRKEEDTKNIKD